MTPGRVWERCTTISPTSGRLPAAVYVEVLSEYQRSFLVMLRAHATAEAGIRGGVGHHLAWGSPPIGLTRGCCSTSA